jgi:SpoIID/LytB domain protein
MPGTLLNLSSFLQKQLLQWDVAKANYQALAAVEKRVISTNTGDIVVQFNPARIVSSGAKTDAKSIEARPCFLCATNRPTEQLHYSYLDRYDILVNPFPIFPEHFTVPHKQHIPQQIFPYFGDMLDLACDFSSYVVFYNGPACGASAPDHLHFQLGNKGFLPIEKDYDTLPKKPILPFSYLQYQSIETDFYHAIVIESETKEDVEKRFSFLYKQLQKTSAEPMMNVVCWHSGTNFVVVVLPRTKHRPTQFFADDDSKILLSPASVDLGGVLITPMERDFVALQLTDIVDISSQVCLSVDAVTNMLKNPFVTIGIVSSPTISFGFTPAPYVCTTTNEPMQGEYMVSIVEGKILFNNQLYNELSFEPVDFTSDTFWVHDVIIGVNFHWQRKENQCFKGSLRFVVEHDKIVLINRVQVEEYLRSVISSEMSATSSFALLKAHAVISRSWLFAQIQQAITTKDVTSTIDGDTIIKWYDHHNHLLFDVCADDHCQRYQGVTRVSTNHVQQAIDETCGEVLVFDNQLCDARFSKCCGGVTEEYATCWENSEVPYLGSIVDAKQGEKKIDLRTELAVSSWIKSSPTVFCNTADTHILSQILPHYDQETTDFFRWKKVYSQHELATLLHKRSGIDVGNIQEIRPIKRGKSGRLEILEIVGTKRTVRVGKELEIRKWFSDTHLYSSAFIVERDNKGNFVFTGAGWGHGVGLCQIGAAVMSEQGYSYKEILQHYYTGVDIVSVY